MDFTNIINMFLFINRLFYIRKFVISITITLRKNYITIFNKYNFILATSNYLYYR